MRYVGCISLFLSVKKKIKILQLKAQRELLCIKQIKLQITTENVMKNTCKIKCSMVG